MSHQFEPVGVGVDDGQVVHEITPFTEGRYQIDKAIPSEAAQVRQNELVWGKLVPYLRLPEQTLLCRPSAKRT